MNWTVVHPLDSKSPLVGFSWDDMQAADVELYILIRGFDDVYSNFVQQRTSYTFNEIVFNKKFVPMYRESKDGRTTILELHRLDETVEAPVMIGAPAARLGIDGDLNKTLEITGMGPSSSSIPGN
jgi:inward rectifier potassium channel